VADSVEKDKQPTNTVSPDIVIQKLMGQISQLNLQIVLLQARNEELERQVKNGGEE